MCFVTESQHDQREGGGWVGRSCFELMTRDRRTGTFVRTTYYCSKVW